MRVVPPQAQCPVWGAVGAQMEVKTMASSKQHWGLCKVFCVCCCVRKVEGRIGTQAVLTCDG